MIEERLIFHVDVNNAFLSWTAVDLLKKGYKRDIRKIASIIGGDESKRKGVVLAKSPVAKRMGIKTAESIYQARRKCPYLEVFAPNMTLYKEQSNLLYQYLTQYTPTIERFSIDECFLDLTGTTLLYQDHLALAYRIKEEIKEKFGFTVNIGIANNKLCAKMASDFEKPDKVHTLFATEIEQKLWPLPVENLFMVGKSASMILHQLGIKTIRELANADLGLLKRYFKSQGIYMKEAASGIDYTKVGLGKDAKNKCISVSRTLPYDMDDPLKLKKVLESECDEVARELRRQKEYARTIAVTFKNEFFESYSHQMKLYNQTNVTEEIYRHVLDIFDRGWKQDKIRNIGVRLSDFVSTKEHQISLFEEKKEEQIDVVQEVIDQINDRFGSASIIPASMKEREK